MNLLHLEYFYTVAKEGGFLRASEKLRINQPAISRMVKNLEHYFGFKLFEKIGRNVKLTPRGEEVFKSCKNIFSEVENLKLSVGKISGSCKGPLLLAAAEPISSHFLPKKIALLLKQYPEIYPNIYSGPAELVLKKIESGEIELGLFFHTPELNEKLTIEKTIAMPFRLVIRSDLKKSSKTLTHFIGSREIDDSSSKRFPTLEILKTKYPDVSIKTSSNNLSTHKELVLNGVGVSILPEFLIQNELKNKAITDVLPEEKFCFLMKIIKRKNSVVSLNALKFLEILI